jgi:hypothetical protein
MSFCQPLTHIYNTLFIKNPVETYNYKAYSDPFQYISWIALAIFSFFVPPILFLIIRGSSKLPSPPSYFGFTLGSSLAFTLGSLTMKSWDGNPKTMSSKLAFFWYVFKNYTRTLQFAL